MKNYIQKFKRFSCHFASFLAVCLLLVCMSARAFAAENDYTLSGRWVFNDTPTFNGSYIAQDLPFSVTLESIGTLYPPDLVIDATCNKLIVSDGNILYSFDPIDGLATMRSINVYSSMPFEDQYGSFVGWNTLFAVPSGFRYLDFGSTPVTVSPEFYRWFTANASSEDITLPVTETLPVVLGWVGSVVTSLFSGELSGLLILLAIPVAIVIVFLGARLLRRLWWGA